MAGKSAGNTAAQDNLIVHFLESGSSRVLNSLQVGQRLTAERGAAAPLMFATPALNRGLVFKDVTGIIRTTGQPNRVRLGTKIYIPFNHNRLVEGGQTFFFDKWDFAKTMASLVDVSEPARVAGLERDQKLLQVLDGLPMFAPFLVRQALEREAITVDPLYAEVPESEWAAICLYIRQRFAQILTAVTGPGAAKGDALNRLLDKLWELSDLPALRGLARAFGLPPDNCIEIFYAWKGMIYFAWLFERVQPDLVEMLTWFEDSGRLTRVCPPDARGPMRADMEERFAQVSEHLNTVEYTLVEYERGFSDLFVHGAGPARFIQFLNNAPSRFAACGVGIGILQHAREVWDRLTRNFPRRDVSHEALQQMLRGLGGVLAEGQL